MPKWMCLSSHLYLEFISSRTCKNLCKWSIVRCQWKMKKSLVFVHSQMKKFTFQTWFLPILRAKWKNRTFGGMKVSEKQARKRGIYEGNEKKVSLCHRRDETDLKMEAFQFYERKWDRGDCVENYRTTYDQWCSYLLLKECFLLFLRKLISEGYPSKVMCFFPPQFLLP